MTENLDSSENNTEEGLSEAHRHIIERGIQDLAESEAVRAFCQISFIMPSIESSNPNLANSIKEHPDVKMYLALKSLEKNILVPPPPKPKSW
ncbi:MAG: hypothetical protein Q8L47_03350 [bacterium]|nr:hypothetical protein [bacterium]